MEIEQALGTMWKVAKMLSLCQVDGVMATPGDVIKEAGAILTKSINKIEHIATTRKIVKEEIAKSFGTE